MCKYKRGTAHDSARASLEAACRQSGCTMSGINLDSFLLFNALLHPRQALSRTACATGIAGTVRADLLSAQADTNDLKRRAHTGWSL